MKMCKIKEIKKKCHISFTVESSNSCCMWEVIYFWKELPCMVD